MNVRHLHIAAIGMAFIGFSFLCASNAYAQIDINSCSAGIPNWAVTTRVVVCVEGSIRMAMVNFLAVYTNYLTPTIFALFSFSMVLMGIKIFSGVEELSKEVLIYIVKFSMVLWFSFNLGGLQDVPFDLIHYGTALVVGGWSPWMQLDTYMGKMFGYGPGLQLFQGLMGLVGAAAFSGITGILIFIMAMLSMITTIYFGFRAVFTYLASVLLVAFLIMISPLIIPLAVFGLTARYVSKWLDYLIAAMMYPIVLFAFLSMFLGTLNYMLEWFIYGAFGGNDFSQYWRTNRSLFSWLVNADPSTVRALESTLGQDTNRTALQTFTSPNLSSAIDLNPINSFALDFGANQVWAMQVMVFGFLGLFIVSYLMVSMINKLPEVSDSITGVATGLVFEGIPFVTEFKQAFMRLKGSVMGR